METAPSNVAPAGRKPRPPFQSSEEVTDPSFKRLADRYGLDTLKRQSGLTTSQLRGKLKESKPLSSLSLSKVKSIGVKGIVGALSMASLGFYVKEVVDVFTTNTSSLDRNAVVTSIVPLVGCAAEAAANQEADKLDALDTSLCFVGDVLMFTPAWPVGLAVHAARFVVGLVEAVIEFENQLNEETLQRLRGKGWDEYCIEVESWLRSDAFKTALEVQLQSEAAAILFAASQARGLLDDQLAPLRENATSQAELRAIYESETRTLDELTHAMCLRMKNMKKKLRDDAIHQLAHWLGSEAERYDYDFMLKLMEEWSMKSLRPWSHVREMIRSVRGKARLLAHPSTNKLWRIIDEHLEPPGAPDAICRSKDLWEPRTGTPFAGSTSETEGPSTTLTPDFGCADPCSPPRGAVSIAFEEITSEGKGIFGCLVRSPVGMTIFEMAPARCRFRELQLKVVTAGPASGVSLLQVAVDRVR